jgi:hypothetical protein
MRAERTLWSVLSKTTAGQRGEAFSWLLYNVAGATLPIWLGGYVLLPVFGKQFSWTEYSKHGELALYSAALLAPTLRVIARDVGESEFVRRQSFLFFCWIFLTGSVALYSGVIAVYGVLPAGVPPAETSLNTILLFRFSLTLFVLTILISFLVRLIDFQRIEPKEILEIQDAAEERLESDFEQTAPTPSGFATTEVAEPAVRRSEPSGDVGTATTLVETEERERGSDTEPGADDGGKKD